MLNRDGLFAWNQDSGLVMFNDAVQRPLAAIEFLAIRHFSLLQQSFMWIGIRYSVGQ